jgi:hypothetical protein
MESESPSPEASAAGAGARREDRVLPIVLLAAFGLVGAWLVATRPEAPPPGPHDAQAGAETPWTPSPQPEGETVSLEIDFGNGAAREFTLPWSEGMTLGELMGAARKFRPGVTFTQQGEGEQAFLTSLEGVANEGGAGRYWLYSVDGEHGKVSFAVQPLEAGAAVLWEFRRGE